jgi:hypothetical protein
MIAQGSWLDGKQRVELQWTLVDGVVTLTRRTAGWSERAALGQQD